MNNERYENMELTYEQMENISGGYKFKSQFEQNKMDEQNSRPILIECNNFINGRLV